MRFSKFLMLFVFRFFFLKKKCEGQDALKGTRHEVLHRILWRDSSGSHQHFFVLFIDRRCLRMFGTSGSGAAIICNIVLQCAPMFHALVFHCGVFQLSAAQQWTSVSVKNCTTRGVPLHSSVCTLPFFGAGQPLDRTTVADQPVVFIVCTRETSCFLGLLRRWPDVSFLKLFESL